MKSNEKCDAANDWYKKYETLDTTGDIRAKKHLEAWEYAKKLKTGKNKYEISPVSFNSPENDFSPSFYGDKLLFTSSRKEDRIVKRVHSWDDRPFLDLFVFENQEVKWLDKKINSSDYIQQNDVYTWMWHNWDGQETGKIIEANGKDCIRFSFAETCEVTVTLEQRGEAVLLSLTQSKI
ncbi:MAG: hypothetical protein IH946_06030, partial [Bacteroidetes bacterium]|nr:hypothetical protein [Bacteroidota bacterium]